MAAKKNHIRRSNDERKALAISRLIIDLNREDVEYVEDYCEASSARNDPAEAERHRIIREINLLLTRFPASELSALADVLRRRASDPNRRPVDASGAVLRLAR